MELVIVPQDFETLSLILGLGKRQECSAFQVPTYFERNYTWLIGDKVFSDNHDKIVHCQKPKKF